MRAPSALFVAALLVSCAEPTAMPFGTEPPSLAPKPSGITIIDLGSPTSNLGTSDAGSTARAVNRWGVAVGTAQMQKYQTPATHAMRWSIDAYGRVAMDDLMPALGLPFTGYANAIGINDAGVIVGVSRASETDPSHAFALESGGAVDLHTLPPCSEPVAPAAYSHAWGINNNGEVVGTRGTPNEAIRAFHVSLADRCVIDLPTLGTTAEARAISDNSVITGWSAVQYGAAKQAVVWTRGPDGRWTIRSLGPEHADAFAINALGEIAGERFFPSGGSLPDQLAFAWLGAGATTPTTVGTLGGLQSAASGISTTGRIVGWAHDRRQIPRPFLWTPGSMRDLGTLGGKTGYANAINGVWIVGSSDIATAGNVSTAHATLWKLQ